MLNFFTTRYCYQYTRTFDKWLHVAFQLFVSWRFICQSTRNVAKFSHCIFNSPVMRYTCVIHWKGTDDKNYKQLTPFRHQELIQRLILEWIIPLQRFNKDWIGIQGNGNDFKDRILYCRNFTISSISCLVCVHQQL